MVSPENIKKSSKSMKKPSACVCDIDDTVVLFLEHLCFIHNKKYGTCITASDITEWNFDNISVKDELGNHVTGEDLRRTFKDTETKGLYSLLPVMKEARLALELMHDLGYKVILMTARKPEFKDETELYLLSKEIYHDEIHFEKDKVKKIKELKKQYNIVLFADDNYDNVRNVTDNCNIRNNFLISKAHNEKIQLDDDIIRIKTLFDAVRYLGKVK